MHLFKCGFFTLLFLLKDPLFAQDSSCNQILNCIIKTLPTSGVLKKNSEGFIYVDLNDDYIHKMIPFIQNEGFEKPPYFGKPPLVGAHITVIRAEEMKRFHLISHS